MKEDFNDLPGYLVDSEWAFHAWAKGKDDAAVQAAVDENRFVGNARMAARTYLARRVEHHAKQERLAQLVIQQNSLDVAERSAKASAESARWTMWAAIAAAVGAAASAIVPVVIAIISPQTPTRADQVERQGTVAGPDRETAVQPPRHDPIAPESLPRTEHERELPRPAPSQPEAKTGT